jgi:hypothetical protein
METSKALLEYIVETLWSQWRELGVAATVPRRHSDDFIDPEPLIAFTATHSDLDARLRDESIDWVLRYGTYVSKARLKNVLAQWGAQESTLFREYAATVNAQGGAGWPAASAKPLAFRSRGRYLLEDLTRQALISVRIRAVFGVGARAELIRAFLSRPAMALTAADLSAETNYGKRNVLNELEPLRFAGVVKSFRAVNADRFSLAKAAQIKALLGPLPERFTPWSRSFGLLHVLLEVANDGAKRGDLQNAVAAVRFIEERRELFSSAEVHPPSLPAGVAAWPVFVDWVVGYARGLARVQPARPALRGEGPSLAEIVLRDRGRPRRARDGAP